MLLFLFLFVSCCFAFAFLFLSHFSFFISLYDFLFSFSPSAPGSVLLPTLSGPFTRARALVEAVLGYLQELERGVVLTLRAHEFLVLVLALEGRVVHLRGQETARDLGTLMRTKETRLAQLLANAF